MHGWGALLPHDRSAFLRPEDQEEAIQQRRTGAVKAGRRCGVPQRSWESTSELPRHVPTAEELREEAAAVEPPKKSAQDLTGQGVVLLVEDEDPVRAVNARALTARGYTVLEAASGIEALQIIEERGGPVDIVVSDVVMPEISGAELSKRLAARNPQMKLLFMSGYIGDDILRQGIQQQDVPFLQKPFTPLILARKVREVLDGSSVRSS